MEAVSSISKQFARLVREADDKAVSIVAVAGAGGLGRRYVNFSRGGIRRGVDLHLLSLEASRLNALLLSTTLHKRGIATNLEMPQSWGELDDEYLSSGNFECVVLGGIDPGMTADSTAATIAQERSSPVFVIVSTVGGIFSRPRGGDILAGVNRHYLREIIAQNPTKHVLDSKTCEILLRGKNRGMKVIVTGHKNIYSGTKGILAAHSPDISFSGVTRILV